MKQKPVEREPLCYCFTVETFFILYYVADLLSATIQMKATDQHFPVVLFIMLYKVVLGFESVDQILECDHSDQYFPVVLFIMLYKGGSWF